MVSRSSLTRCQSYLPNSLFQDTFYQKVYCKNVIFISLAGCPRDQELLRTGPRCPAAVGSVGEEQQGRLSGWPPWSPAPLWWWILLQLSKWVHCHVTRSIQIAGPKKIPTQANQINKYTMEQTSSLWMLISHMVYCLQVLITLVWCWDLTMEQTSSL